MDLDSKADILWYKYAFPKVLEFFPLREIEQWPSKSGKGIHVVLESSTIPLSIEERLLLQCILGSDRLRELYSMARIGKVPVEIDSVLFRPPNPDKELHDAIGSF